MLVMINEKTGVFKNTQFHYSGQPYYLGAVFEPKVDFAKKTVKQSVKCIKVYQFRDERFRVVPYKRERQLLNAQPKLLMKKLLDASLRG